MMKSVSKANEMDVILRKSEEDERTLVRREAAMKCH